MPVTLALTIAPSNPGHGDTVTATYTVQGNDGIPPQAAEVSGTATIGGADLDVSTVITLPAAPPLGEEFDAPTGAGLTWEATPDPKVWTAVIP